MRITRCFSILSLTILLAAAPALAGNPVAKATKLSLRKPAPARPAPLPAVPVDNGIGALSSCKKHVENMLKNPATQFESDGSIRVVKTNEENFDVAGPVRSANASGQAIGGAVWSTKTSLDFAR